MLEARAAQHRAALRRLERNGRFRAAFAADGTSFCPYPSPGTGCALDLALLASLGIVLELFVMEEELLSRGKDEIISAVHALQYFVDELHTFTLTLNGICRIPQPSAVIELSPASVLYEFKPRARAAE